MDLNVVWFILIGVLFSMYIILDGFDLGAGILYLFAKNPEEKRIYIRAIGPFWDGNEVWLVAAVGATFAAFPGAYTAVLSGLYIPTMLLIFFLIFRAVSIEFTNHVHSPRLSRIWDISFGVGSFGVAFLLGILLGNILQGFEIDKTGVHVESLYGLVNSFTLMCGVMSVLICVMHGAVFLMNKTYGSVEARINRKFPIIWWGLFVMLILSGVASMTSVPHLSARYFDGWTFPVITLVFAVCFVLVLLFRASPRLSFLFSALSILCAAILIGGTHFPNIVPSRIDPNYGLTIYNTASEPQTHFLMLVIAAVGVPLVLVYTGVIYYVFRGKVNIRDGGYDV